MRSGIGGCVLNRRLMMPGRFGSAIQRCAIELLVRATGRALVCSFASAVSRPSGSRVVIALVASARYSRCREMAACTTAAVSGARIAATSPIAMTTRIAGPPMLLSRERVPKKIIRNRMSEIRPTATTRPKTMSETRMS